MAKNKRSNLSEGNNKNQKFKTYGSLTISLLTAISTIATAWFLKDTNYENAWLWVFTAWMLVAAGFELYASRRINKKIR